MSAIKVTVLFATYNGGKTLPRMLEALTKVTLPHDQWKIVAVDNNSNDNTPELLKSFQNRLPLEVYSEPRQGKENALATGFLHLEGELVIMTDDDVIPQPDWVGQYLELAEQQPDYSIFSGLIVPGWEVTPPDWLLKWAPLNILYADNSRVPVGEIPSAWVHGPNCAYRRSVLGNIYAGSPGLGPNANVTQYAMGQDTMFARNISDKAFHTNKAVVQHIVFSNQLTREWILGRGERYGLGQPLTRSEWFKEQFYPLGKPLKASILLAAAFVKLQVFRLLRLDGKSFGAEWEFRRRLGNYKTLCNSRASDKSSKAA